MKKLFLKAGLALISAVTLSHCGGGLVAEPLDDATAPTLFARFSSLVIGDLPTDNNSLPASVEEQLGVVTFSGPGATQTPTVAVDADGDGIPLDVTRTYDSYSDGTRTWKGQFTLRDLDDTVAGLLGGYEAANNVEFASDDLYTAHNGVYSHQVISGVHVSKSEYKGRTVNEKAGYDYTFDFAWDYRLTPDDDSNPWAEGSVELSGHFGMEGTFIIGDEHLGGKQSMTGSYVLSYSSKNLTIQNGKLHNGSLIMDDNNGTEIVIVYENGVRTLLVNGTKSDWLP